MSVKRLAIIAMLTAMAIVLSILESFIPMFIPGVKLGLANVIILIMLYEFKISEALIVDILRILVVAILRSTLLSPTFIMSLSGGVLSFVIMLIFSRIKVFSIIGVFIIIICYLFRSVFLNSTFYLVLFSTFVCGFGSGALYSLPSSLYADEVSKQNKTSGLDRTATFSGIFTFTSNLFSSVSLFFVGIMLDLIGFDSSLSSQTLKVQMWLAIILFVGVELSLIVGYYFFSLYNVRKRKNKVNMV